MLETHIIMSLLIFCLTLILVLCLVLLLMLCLTPFMDLTITHIIFVSQENNFVPRRFGYDPRPNRGDVSRIGMVFLLEGFTLILS
jgi:hypothetical protein